MMTPLDIIEKKIAKQVLTKEEIAFFVDGITDWTISEPLIAAFAMAVCINGFTRDETTHLAKAMAESGNVMDYKKIGIDAPVLGRYSSGGAGDYSSLILAPLIAACGGIMPMVSVRGQGYTGTTLSKIESVLGYNTVPPINQFKATIKEFGCAIIDHISDLAPADKKMSEVRNQSGTVNSIPLIVASIIARKKAAGIKVWVTDIKYGDGHFMKNKDMAVNLGNELDAVAGALGIKTTNMLIEDFVPGDVAGCALEIKAAVEFLAKTSVNPAMNKLVLNVGSRLLIAGDLATDENDARKKLDNALTQGTALERFGHMLKAFGAPADFTLNCSRYLPKSPIIKPVFARKKGIVQKVNPHTITAIVEQLGGGQRYDHRTDYSVGLSSLIQRGDKADEKSILAYIHAPDNVTFEMAEKDLVKAVTIEEA